MNIYDACEQAYKRGYEDGKRDSVKHGKWGYIEKFIPVLYTDDYGDLIEESEQTYHKRRFLVCEVCSKEPILSNLGSVDWEYCPHCGAKMDGERKCDE